MLFKNDKAVSPVVATLVLIVVAIIGAAAVGLLLGSFSSDVSEQTSPGETQDASNTDITIGGSTTVFPLTEEIRDAFVAEDGNDGVGITVLPGGSSAGREGCQEGILDIGSCSSWSTSDTTSYPDLVPVEIGGSAVVLIAHGGATITAAAGVDGDGAANSINQMYSTLTAGTGASTVAVTDTAAGTIPVGTICYQRDEASGTEETFAKYINYKETVGLDTQLPVACNALKAIGNAGVYTAVSSATVPTVGFVDFGFVDTAAVTIIGIDCTNAIAGSATEIKKSLTKLHKGETSAAGEFPTGLCRNLWYCTKGPASTLENAFINYAKSSDQDVLDAFEDVGYFTIYDY